MSLRVKVCGVTRLEDALLAADLGAAAIGFVFWPGSPRCIDPYRARDIALALPPLVTPVGVFVDQPVEYVEGVAALARLGAVQLHGNESPAYCRRLRRRLIRAVAVTPAFTPAALVALDRWVLPLLDVHDPVRKGGTGRVIDWTKAAEAAALRPSLLAGGLRVDNVQEALRRVRPYGIDVASGLEARPGVKDPGRMREFMQTVREWEPDLAAVERQES